MTDAPDPEGPDPRGLVCAIGIIARGREIKRRRAERLAEADYLGRPKAPPAPAEQTWDEWADEVAKGVAELVKARSDG